MTLIKTLSYIIKTNILIIFNWNWPKECRRSCHLKIFFLFLALVAILFIGTE